MGEENKKIAWIITLVVMVGCTPVSDNTSTVEETGTTTTVVSSADTTATAETTTASAGLTAEEVVLKLKEAGVEVETVVSYTEETDANNLLGRPDQYTSKTNFSIKGDDILEGQDPDNTIEVFENEADARARKEYIEEVIKGIAFAQQYIYHSGVYVLRIDNQTTPTAAREIEQKFLDIVK